MQLQFFIYLIPLLLSPVISILIGIQVWKHRRQSAPGAMWLGLLIFSTVWWGICYLLQITAGTNMDAQIFWNTARQIGSNFVTPYLFLFALEYTGHKKWVTRSLLWGLFGLSIIITLFTFTNELHHLYWPTYELVQSGPFLVLVFTRSVINLIYVSFSYLLILAATVLLLQWTYANYQNMYRRQIAAFIIAIFAPLISNILFFTGSVLIDLTPFAFTVTTLGFSFALFQYRMLDISPVARELIVEEMSDGVIVLNEQNQIVDINPTARKLTGINAKEAIGRDIRENFKSWPDIFNHQKTVHDEVIFGEGSQKKWIELGVSPLYNKRKNFIGRLLLLRDITKTKVQELALRESEEKYRRIYENLEDVLYETDYHGTLTSVSPSIEKQTGYTQKEIIGLNVVEFYAFPEDYEALVTAIVEKGFVNDFEVRLKKKDGSNLFVSVTAGAFFNANGQPVGTEGSMRNITERKLAEKKLRESQSRYRDIFDGVQEAIFVESESGEVLDVNQAACEMYGYTYDEFLTKTVRDLVPADMALILPGTGTLSSSIRETIETLNQRASGEVFQVEVSGQTQSIGEKVVRLVIVRDLSRSKQAEEQLHMQRVALESADNAIVISDFNGRIEWTNPAFTRLTGYTLQEAVGQTTNLLKSGKHDKAFYQNLWHTVNSGQVWQGEITNRRKDGSLYIEEQTITPVVDEAGKILRFIAIKQDVTEQRIAREQLEKQNDYLSVLHQITLDLLNRRNPADLFQAIVDRAADLLDAPYAEFDLIEGEELVVSSATQNQSNLIGERSTREQSKLSWQVYDTGEPVVLDDYGAWSGRRTEVASYTGLSATADFPVLVNNQCVAILAVGRTKPDHTFTAEEIQTGILFSRMLGLVLDNVNLYDSALTEISERKRTEEKLNFNLQQQKSLSSLLELGLKDISLDNLLPSILDEILSLSWMTLTPKGGIFLVEDQPNVLVLKAHKNLASPLHTLCANVKFGQCLCGQAAATRQIQFSDCVDEKHEITYQGMEDHGHYNIPIMSGNKVLGVIVLYLPHGHQKSEDEELFLHTVADVIAGIIGRKHAETLLLESEVRFRQIVESASDLIYRADMEGRFTYFNPTAMKLFGFTEESQVIGRHFLELAAPASHDELIRVYKEQVAEHKQTTYHEFIAKTASGQEIWLGQNVQLIIENGQPLGVQAVARDITKLKQAYEALFIARDQALEASQLKSQLLARVSHELRTPLGGVIGYAELLHHDTFGKLTDEQKNATQQIMASTQYLTSIINDLLDEAQIETRSVVLKREKFSPAEILKKVETTMSVLAKNKGLILTTTLFPDMPETLTGDMQRLQQIMINLVGNAIKFTAKGEIHLSLRRPIPEQWVIQVSDTGVGIPAEAQSYIFDAFRQIDNSITRENRGSGLGLSITKQLVELMGGEINLQSEVGKGSTFAITLPIQHNTENKK